MRKRGETDLEARYCVLSFIVGYVETETTKERKKWCWSGAYALPAEARTQSKYVRGTPGGDTSS